MTTSAVFRACFDDRSRLLDRHLRKSGTPRDSVARYSDQGGLSHRPFNPLALENTAQAATFSIVNGANEKGTLPEASHHQKAASHQTATV